MYPDVHRRSPPIGSQLSHDHWCIVLVLHFILRVSIALDKVASQGFTLEDRVRVWSLLCRSNLAPEHMYHNQLSKIVEVRRTYMVYH